MGKKVGVSGEQVRRVKKILESASDEQLRNLRRDEATIREVFNALKEFNTHYEKVEIWTIDGKLMIRQDFHEIMPPLQEHELNGLENDILKYGCSEPIAVWNNIILDGHHRYKICCKHGIEYKTFNTSEKIKDANQAKIWIIKTQLARRNPSEFGKGEMLLNLERVINEEKE